MTNPRPGTRDEDSPPRARSRVAALAFLCLAIGATGCKGRFIRPTTAEKFEATPERLQRGQYLVNQVMACGACHTSRPTGNLFVEGEQTDLFLAGGNTYQDRAGRLHIPNITPDPDTGLGGWTDDQVLRAIRDGIDKNGNILLPMMPYDDYQHLSDEDGKAVVAYLRSVPAAKPPRPRFAAELKLIAKVLLTKIGVQMHKPVTNVSTPDRADKVAYGRYLANIAACTDCHSLTDKAPRREGEELFMAGSSVAFTDPRLGKVYTRNLTPDAETGLGKYKPEQIKQAMRDGKRLDGKRMAPPMSMMIPHYSGMTDEDLDALCAYLVSLTPYAHKVPEPELSPEVQKMVAE